MRRSWSWVGTIALMGGLMAPGAACARNDGKHEKQQATSEQKQGAKITKLSAGALAQHPERYYGMQVSVKAEVEDILNRQAFTLDEDRLFAGPDVLVIVPGAAELKDDQNVTVVGTVRPFVEADLRRDYDWFDRTPDLVVRFRDRPVIIAQSIRSTEGKELVLNTGASGSEGMAQGEQKTDRTRQGGQDQERQPVAGSAGQERQPVAGQERGGRVIRDLSMLTGSAEPASLVGRKADLVTVKVQKVLSDRAFLVATEVQEPLLVILEPSHKDLRIQEGDQINVRGTIQKVPAQPQGAQFSQLDNEMLKDHSIYLSAQLVLPSASGTTLHRNE